MEREVVELELLLALFPGSTREGGMFHFSSEGRYHAVPVVSLKGIHGDTVFGITDGEWSEVIE